MKLVPTTTIAALTGNNTSASGTFKPWGNGNAPIGNVSKENIRELLPTGVTVDNVFAHLMPWWTLNNNPPGKSHPDIGYASSDPAQIQKQYADMVSRGITGIFIDYYGDPADGPVMTGWLAVAKAGGIGFTVGLIIDKGVYQGSSAAVSQANCINLVKTYNIEYGSHPNYIKIGNKPVFGFFLGTQSLNWATVKSGVGPNVLIMPGPDIWTSDCCLGWGPLGPAAYYTSFYAKARTFTIPVVAPVSVGFWDLDPLTGGSVWGGPVRYCARNSGATWLQRFACIPPGNYWGLQAVTWNDYEEGDEIESGIQSGASLLTFSVTDATVYWAVAGNQYIHHIEIVITSDSINAQTIPLPPSAISYNLAVLGLDPDTYKVAIQLVGWPCLQNVISNSFIPVVIDGPVIPPIPPIPPVTPPVIPPVPPVANPMLTITSPVPLSTVTNPVRFTASYSGPCVRFEVWAANVKVAQESGGSLSQTGILPAGLVSVTIQAILTNAANAANDEKIVTVFDVNVT